ncbi:hypothetical protein [Ectothiorhodospira shaposhnikovii]|uniref:hypothetical protein n=1 Tax=Ectothiorhodospira shaposhnikovii TaxID=1054 RepID=UPI001EE96E86|nr:hypothetical protein [Ectothiorhodospira shaposhnikovii]MCG5512781.1 hypothetical protein [Ectothiorhodospira shaposhnikovii]
MTTETSVEKFIDADQLMRDSSFGDTNFDEAVQEQAGLMAHYGVLAAKAERQAAIKKLSLEALEAKLDKEIRDEAASSGTKITETQIEKAIKRDSRYVRAALAVIEAKTVETMAKNAIRAISDKRDMLIQTGSDRRKDMDGTLRVMAKEAAETRANSLRDRALAIAKGAEH